MSDAVTTLAIPASHPIFAGHFPGHPIVPAAMLLEWITDVAAARAGCGVERLEVREAKFLEPLLPAQQAELTLDASTNRMPFRIVSSGRTLVTGVLERRGD